MAFDLIVEFREDGVVFSNYPFTPASVYRSGVVGYSAIREVLPHMWPPEIRTLDGEILFVSATQQEQLLAAAERHALPVVARIDVWDLILEPFLDTEFDERAQERTLKMLQENGVGRDLCEALRSEVGPAMYHYNFAAFLWEWVHLGLYDLLSAMTLDPSRLLPWQPGRPFATFYWEAMEIANRSRLVQHERSTPSTE